MTYDYQLTVDCRDPHVLAEWWAETLGWLVEPSNEEFIKSMIEAGHASDDDTTRHHGVLVWRTGAAIARRVSSSKVMPGRQADPPTTRRAIARSCRIAGVSVSLATRHSTNASGILPSSRLGP